ncbi:MAG TPA: hypothetical protein VLW85_02045 [Myxococcales bacterium]|nr:hypothetical protein [Myxococcales bacterium]
MKRLALLLLAAACGGVTGNDSDDQNFSSDVATLLVMDLDSSLVTSTSANAAGQMRAQLMWTVGHLNAEPGVARLDKLALSKVATASLGGGLYRISYHVKLPVAWGSKTSLPSSYTFTLPKRVDTTGATAFYTKYKDICRDDDGDTVTVDNFWFHYRPHAGGCTLAAADVTVATATAAMSTVNTVAKYPEYQKVWEDGLFTVVAVFGKYTPGATDPSDPGLAAYTAFAGAVASELKVAAPAADAAHPDVTLRAGNVIVTLLLTDALYAAPASWQKRFAEVSTNADLILYNGHAGLGANVRAMASMGQFFPGRYQILFLDGCDTFAYADDTWATRRAPLNPDDNASGTKYLDIVTNAMPAYFTSLSGASMALLHALAHPESPMTYPQIFHSADPSQVVVVNGEEDNVFHPGMSVAPRWSLAEEGFVGKAESVLYTTDVLPAGSYVFQLSPDPSIAGGDSDLRGRAGAMPTTDLTYKCKSYVGNSNERCKLTLASAQKVYLTVTGDAAGVQSHFLLRAFSQ